MAPTKDMKKLVNVEEVAEILQVPKSWIYQQTYSGNNNIPYYKVGKYLRFDIDEVKEFYHQQRSL